MVGRGRRWGVVRSAPPVSKNTAFRASLHEHTAPHPSPLPTASRREGSAETRLRTRRISALNLCKCAHDEPAATTAAPTPAPAPDDVAPRQGPGPRAAGIPAAALSHRPV